LTDAVAVVIPAKDEAGRVSATVRAARLIPAVDLVVVVDDGSGDSTANIAAAAGALVVRHSGNRGKAAALESGAEAVRVLEQREGRADPRVLLFLDADLANSATAAAVLAGPVFAGEVDMAIGVLPPQRQPGGGHGFVVRLARDGVRAATGWCPGQPLSGQRCLTRAAFDAAVPLAHGFGVEVGLSIDLLRKGFRVREIEADLHHRVTGRDWRAQLHRARQYADVVRALATRRVVPVARPEAGPRRSRRA
jgi:glycosyltransferase involved in cell wall biosynthesis